MKKLFCVLFVLALLMVSVPCFATETDIDIDAIIDTAEKELGQAIDADIDIDQDKYILEDGTFDYAKFLEDLKKEMENAPKDVENENYFKRLWEFVWQHRSGILTTILSAAIAILIAYGKTWVHSIIAKIDFLNKKQTETEKLTDAQVTGYNEMVSATNKMTEALNVKTAEDATRDSIATKNTAMLNFMMNVMMVTYTNSKNVPEYIKAAIQENYYSLKKELGDDDKLLELFGQLIVDEEEET